MCIRDRYQRRVRGNPNHRMATGGKSIGIPIKLLHEAEGHTITLETKNGEVFRGQLLESEDNMNCYIGSVTMTARDGRTSKLEQVAIRGSQVRFMILPDMLKNAPMFKRAEKPGASAGRGRGAAGKTHLPR
eukprot:TRINITY_DN6304_c0_g1_i2.p1 TRINITY_DN6304_c0_g1~~TRINITY_DN6304_c0_g1_i2.p1  ORF type:complete len:131 (-),score=30.21 TRINITY_DN6304_c0_g1_i2:374-766(-)